MAPSDNQNHMKRALIEAQRAGAFGEVPVGAVIIAASGELIADSGNRTVELNDPTAHAEIVAIRKACDILKSQRLTGCDLYVTLEPCAMCAAAISFARIRRLYYATADLKGGAVENGPRFYSQPTCHHAPEIYPGLYEQESATLLRTFFEQRR